VETVKTAAGTVVVAAVAGNTPNTTYRSEPEHPTARIYVWRPYPHNRRCPEQAHAHCHALTCAWTALYTLAGEEHLGVFLPFFTSRGYARGLFAH
jgi:hypothetical protein